MDKPNDDKRASVHPHCSTDIERLHHVVASDYGPNDRGVGKTHAHCHELCGSLEVGGRDVICLVVEMRRVEHIVPMLERVFVEHGIRILQRLRNGGRTQLIVLVPGVGERKVRFVRFGDDESLRGLDCNVVEFHD